MTFNKTQTSPHWHLIKESIVLSTQGRQARAGGRACEGEEKPQADPGHWSGTGRALVGHWLGGGGTRGKKGEEGPHVRRARERQGQKRERGGQQPGTARSSS